jgi:hypothetical protein
MDTAYWMNDLGSPHIPSQHFLRMLNAVIPVAVKEGYTYRQSPKQLCNERVKEYKACFLNAGAYECAPIDV